MQTERITHRQWLALERRQRRERLAEVIARMEAERASRSLWRRIVDRVVGS